MKPATIGLTTMLTIAAITFIPAQIEKGGDLHQHSEIVLSVRRNRLVTGRQQSRGVV